MLKFKTGFFALILSLIAFFGFIFGKVEEARGAKGSQKKLTEAQTDFAFQIFSQIRKSEGKKTTNLFVSPLSISLALSMTANGAKKETLQEMQKALSTDKLSRKEVNHLSRDLLKALQNSDPQVKLEVANSIWANESYPFRKSFMNRCKKYFQAGVFSRDFSNPSTLKEINQWTSDHTAGKINPILNRIRRDDMMFLINAIYFKASWHYKFDKKRTVPGVFTAIDGTKSTRDFMRTKKRKFKYLKNDQFQAIALPYGKEKRMKMYVFLPGEKSSLDKFCSHLNSSNWKKWTGKMRKTKGRLALPKFKIEYGVKLKGKLQRLGMKKAFTRNANFQDMTDVGCHISFVKHKAFIEVDEKGTEAAAATIVGIRKNSISRSFAMAVNRPFFFAIADDKTDSILFMGTVSKLK